MSWKKTWVEKRKGKWMVYYLNKKNSHAFSNEIEARSFEEDLFWFIILGATAFNIPVKEKIRKKLMSCV